MANLYQVSLSLTHSHTHTLTHSLTHSLTLSTVSRSIGDGRFKHIGVISTPDVFRVSLTHNDQFLLLACDGLWKVFTVDDAVQFVHRALIAAKVW